MFPPTERYANYPDALDVELKLKSATLWPTDEAKILLAKNQADIGARASAAKWEQITAWRPYLALPTDNPNSVRAIPFPGTDLNGRLKLRRAAREIISVSWQGRTLTQGQDWRASDGVDWAIDPPFTELEFQHALGANSVNAAQFDNPIIVTARWGLHDELPADAWEQCERAGALGALTSIENLQSIAEISQDGFSKAFDITGIITQQNLLAEWGKNFLATAILHRRSV